MLSAEELLAGSELEYEVEVPGELVRPNGGSRDAGDPDTVRLRPLTVRDLTLVTRAARENDELVATLMVQRALVEPALSVAEVARMPVGLVEFLLDQVNRLSGIATPAEEIEEAATAPLARAAHLLAQEFGWTPQQVSDMTLGQILLHLGMLDDDRKVGAGAR